MTKGALPLTSSHKWVSRDSVHVERLRVNAVVGPDAWDKLQPQNLEVSLHMGTDFQKSSQTDDLKYSLNYAVVSRDVSSVLQENTTTNYKDIYNLGKVICEFAKKNNPGIESLAVEVESQEADIRASSIRCEVFDTPNYNGCITISDFKMLTLIGVFSFERLKKQYVDFSINIPVEQYNEVPPYNKIVEQVTEYVENSNFKTVEALVESVAQVILTKNPYFNKRPNSTIGVRVIKLNAITQTAGVGVSCERCLNDFASAKPVFCSDRTVEDGLPVDSRKPNFDLPVQSSTLDESSWKSAVLAFGSNVGDRFENVTRAIELLKTHKDVKLLSTSSLFESEPMYFKDQMPFLNGCVKIQTRLLPHELLKLCKTIEYDELHRVKHFDNGPRSIDLDIVTYYDSQGEDYLVNTPDLTIPHARMLERSFVLEPLCELIAPTELHPVTAEPIFNHLKQIYENDNPEDLLWRLVPVGNKFLKFKTHWEEDPVTGVRRFVSKYSAYMMGVVNVTPDSFSDGSANYNNTELVLAKIESMISSALELHEMVILDIGGCSTRPGSLQATESEELSRIIPIINALTSSKTIPLDKVVISIDTYRGKVAEEAIKAGVGMINDISGGVFDPSILEVVGKHPNVAYVLSHIRGTISSMSSQTSYTSVDGDVKEYIFGKEDSSKRTTFIRTIARELCSRYQDIVKNGIHRWQLILDPGIGFAKVGNQNLELIRNVPLLRNYSCVLSNQYHSLANLPVLLGPSRKKFIGDITKVPVAKDRDFATGTLVSACVANGCDIIRIHDVENISKSLKLVNELYRY